MNNLWDLILGETATPADRDRARYFSDAQGFFAQYCHLKQGLPDREGLSEVQAAAMAFESLTGVSIKKAEDMYLVETRRQIAEEKAARSDRESLELKADMPRGVEAVGALQKALGVGKEK